MVIPTLHTKSIRYPLSDFRGRYFIELALALNPRYDFAREALVRCDREFSSFQRNGATEEERTIGTMGALLVNIMKPGRHAPRMLDSLGLKDDPAQRYYMWTKQFGISFSHHDSTPTKQVIIKRGRKA